jgi:transcriptional regulator with XRE-family HTH domain
MRWFAKRTIMKKNWREQLGERLHTIRHLRGKKQLQVSLSTGIPAYQLSRTENGRSDLTFHDALQLALEYQCALSAFDPARPLGDVGSVLPKDPPAASQATH